MTRPADERAFGFRAKGILRILVAADPEQVLIAVEELGFRLPDIKPIGSLGEFIFEVHSESERVIGEFFTNLSILIGEIIPLLEHELPGGHSSAPHRAMQRALTQFRSRQNEFILDLRRKRESIEKQTKETQEAFIL